MRPVVGYEGLYSVTNDGRIWSHPRQLRGRNNSVRNSKGQWLKPRNSTGGYPAVSLWKFGKIKNFRVHRLLAMAFIENPNSYPHVNHINRNRKDSRAENLEWCTAQQNNIHKYSFGDYVASKRQRSHARNMGRSTRKLTPEKAAEIIRQHRAGITMRALATRHSLSLSGICMIINQITYPEAIHYV